MEILIIEDDLSNFKYYLPLGSLSVNVNLLFVAARSDYSIERMREQIELIYGSAFSWIKRYFVCNTETISKFLKDNPFDFYIIDSLSGRALEIIKEANLSKEKIVFFSGDTPFRELAEKESYRAYRKKDINELINIHLK
jgi:hypothetical protein